jgi:hypothetical protein
MRLIVVPSLITLAVTLLRLTGERLGWSKTLFNPEAGGGFALVGISWLPIILGAYFGLKLARRGEGPGSAGKAVGFAVLGIVIMFASAFALNAIKPGPAVSIAIFGVVGLGIAVLAYRGWPALGRTLFAYALAARIPVALVKPRPA